MSLGWRSDLRLLLALVRWPLDLLQRATHELQETTVSFECSRRYREEA